MLGISYGELFLLIGATAALVGTKDLPILARTAGRIAGRAIGYVQLARGQFDNVMQQSQARQVHKELQDTMAQLEAIRHEIRSISIINPGPLTRGLSDKVKEPNHDGNSFSEKCQEDLSTVNAITKNSKIQASDLRNKHGKESHYAEPVESMIYVDASSKNSNALASDLSNLHRKATAYAKLAESEAVKTSSLKNNAVEDNFNGETLLFNVLPVSAESAGLLQCRKDNVQGSDLMLEAVVEAEVAKNAKDFFSQPQNQMQ